MISILSKIMILMISMFMISIKNPVKMSMILMTLSLSIFMFMAMNSGKTWFPILFSLLFMGGILMMFMILSSIMPNEKSPKMSMITTIVLTSILISSKNLKEMNEMEALEFSKSFLSSSSSFHFLILILILYFFSTITMLCKVELPMRSILCCK